MGFWCQNTYLLPGCKKFKQKTEKRLPARKERCYFREKSGVLASRKRANEALDAQYLDHKGVRKRFTKKIPNKKWAHGSKDVGFIKNPHFSVVCPQNGISEMC